MLAPLFVLILPFLANACFCPSCGCSCCSGYNNYYNAGQQQGYSGAVGYGQPYTVFFNQPIPAGRGVEVRYPQVPAQQPQYLPPLQQFPQIAQSPPLPQYPPQQQPQFVQPQPSYVQAPQIPVVPQQQPALPATPPVQPTNTYDLPIVPKTNTGYQPARQVETLSRRPIVDSADFTTVAPLSGTTRIVPAKQGKNKDYEYYYVYYDEDGKKLPGKAKANPGKGKSVHDGSIQQRATTAAPQNSIDEYDFDDKNVEIPAPTTHAPSVVVVTATVGTPSTTTPDFVEPQGEVHAVVEVTTVPTIPVPVQTTAAAREPVQVEDVDGDAIYEDDLTSTTSVARTTAATATPAETVTFETSAPTTATTTTAAPSRAAVTAAGVEAATKDSKNYEYEEYEVEEIQLVNENGVTETVTRIITTTKAPKL